MILDEIDRDSIYISPTISPSFVGVLKQWNVLHTEPDSRRRKAKRLKVVSCGDLLLEKMVELIKYIW
jgi:hypothetical protein